MRLEVEQLEDRMALSTLTLSGSHVVSSDGHGNYAVDGIVHPSITSFVYYSNPGDLLYYSTAPQAVSGEDDFFLAGGSVYVNRAGFVSGSFYSIVHGQHGGSFTEQDGFVALGATMHVVSYIDVYGGTNIALSQIGNVAGYFQSYHECFVAGGGNFSFFSSGKVTGTVQALTYDFAGDGSHSFVVNMTAAAGTSGNVASATQVKGTDSGWDTLTDLGSTATAYVEGYLLAAKTNPNIHHSGEIEFYGY